MLARGPREPSAAQYKRAVSSHQTQEDVVEAKLSIPKIKRDRGVSNKFDISKFEF